MRAEMKKLERPKRPKNAYALFVSENFRKGGNSQAEVTRISELWNMTPEEDRVPFQEEAKKLKEEYDVELEAWKAKMIAEGRQDLFEPKDKKAKKSKSKRQVKRKSKAAKEEVDEEEEWEEEEEEEDDDGF
ncbi:transcription factor A, mitochondrial-like [Apostichopus japonicus]|uniref:transcription factor A, mitochondrial-like n=1 Tax=Stichopus japonicus TaxID=307972 RepID=UPI003AB80ECB